MKKIIFFLFTFFCLLASSTANTFKGIESYSFGDIFKNSLGSIPKNLGVLGKLYEVENNDIKYDKLFVYVNNDNVITGMLKVKQTPDKKVCNLVLKQRADAFEKENGFKSISFDGGLRLSSDDSPQKNIAMSCDTSNVLSVVFMDLTKLNVE